MLWLPYFARAKALAAAAQTTADAALPASSYTAADVLTKIKTVDGSGSGLDADTVKGKDWTAPGAIGNVTPSSGAFTTLSVSTSSTFPTSSTTPTPTAGSGTFISVSATQHSTKVGDRRHFSVTVIVTTNGTAATDIRVAMPDSAAEVTGGGGINQGSGTAIAWFITGTSLRLFKPDGTYPGGDGVVLSVSGSYRV